MIQTYQEKYKQIADETRRKIYENKLLEINGLVSKLFNEDIPRAAGVGGNTHYIAVLGPSEVSSKILRDFITEALSAYSHTGVRVWVDLHQPNPTIAVYWDKSYKASEFLEFNDRVFSF